MASQLATGQSVAVSDKQRPIHGFTIVELLIVIVVIGVLATIGTFAYNGVQSRAYIAVVSSDLHNAATVVEAVNAETGAYPVTIPSGVKTSPDIILQLADTGNSTSMCINAYNTKDASIRMSWDSSKGGLQSALCSGATTGSSIGGTVPVAARNVNLVADLSHWTLLGGATYNGTTKELILGASGVARSPIVRIDAPALIYVGGDLYATNASPFPSYAPQAGFHTGINYYASDGVTPVMNSGNYTTNGCARPFPTGNWKVDDRQCVYSGGPNVIYCSFIFTGSNGTYASSDLKIKNPLLVVN